MMDALLSWQRSVIPADSALSYARAYAFQDLGKVSDVRKVTPGLMEGDDAPFMRTISDAHSHPSVQSSQALHCMT